MTPHHILAERRPRPVTPSSGARAELRLGLICDLVEENWPSMDLVAEFLWTQLRARPEGEVLAKCIRPRMARRLSRLRCVGAGGMARNGDRFLARFWDYPRHLRRRAGDFDCFHVCDHSYAHLVRELPAERTGVFCHDLDAFRCLLAPELEARPTWFRAMTRRILRGLQRAALIFCSTRVTQERIKELSLVDPSRLVYAPYGVAPEFSAELDLSDAELGRRLNLPKGPWLLHVGSCIPRKRVDVLLDVLSAIRERHPDLSLVQVGGKWTPALLRQITQYRLTAAVRQFRGLDRMTLAALYRRARLVLLPSEAEGFGLPVVEALACGAPVVASELPVLREVGGKAAVYCHVANVPHWVETVARLLTNPDAGPDRTVRIAQARCFSWQKHAETILNAYQGLG